MKKTISAGLFLTLLISFVMGSFSGCSTRTISDNESSRVSSRGVVSRERDNDSSEPEESSQTESSETESSQTESSETSSVSLFAQNSKSTKNMNITEFNELLSKLPVVVVSTKYTVQDEKYKALYPDMLQAIIQNNSSSDIKNAVVAFVAWDNNDLPVKIKANIDFTDGAYIREVNYSDINLVPGAQYGDSSGFEIAEDLNIEKFEAICVSYESFDGSAWTNPYYDEWTKLYEGVKYSDSLTVDVEVEEDSGSTFTSSAPKETTSSESSSSASTSSAFTTSSESKTSDLDEKALNEQINKQEVRVISTKYTVQDEKYKALYPDMLQAIIKNDSKHDIKNAVVAFVAWDNFKLPVKIQANIDFTDGAYLKQVNYSDINLASGETYGEDSGFEIAENLNIHEFKAIVVSYETFDGTKWENPLFDDWCGLYEGKALNLR